jgi:hypothetical protein
MATVKTAKYNGLNFSKSFLRESDLIDYSLQRKKNYLPASELKYLSFYVYELTYAFELADYKIYAVVGGVETSITADSYLTITGTSGIVFFVIPDSVLQKNKDIYFVVKNSGANTIYSEIYTIKSQEFCTENNIVTITAKNNDNRHGYLINQAFGCFKTSGFGEDIFVNSKTEYTQSYNRKKILESENNIVRRIVFEDLTRYDQNLLKWLCNCENMYIDGVQYQLISDFSDILNDNSSEIQDLQADFIEVEQSFFDAGANYPAKDVFSKNMFNYTGTQKQNFLQIFYTIFDSESVTLENKIKFIKEDGVFYVGEDENSITVIADDSKIVENIDNYVTLLIDKN